MSTSRAATYVEGTTDAGQTLATAANAGAATGFSGTLSFAYDTDLYMFTIATAGTYTFSDVGGTVDNSETGPLDTAISLFKGDGTALVTDDDANGSTIESAFTTALTVGTYYFGITSLATKRSIATASSFSTVIQPVTRRRRALPPQA